MLILVLQSGLLFDIEVFYYELFSYVYFFSFSFFFMDLFCDDLAVCLVAETVYMLEPECKSLKKKKYVKEKEKKYGTKTHL